MAKDTIASLRKELRDLNRRIEILETNQYLIPHFSGHAPGCVCPPGSERTCCSPMCPRQMQRGAYFTTTTTPPYVTG